MHSNAEGCKIRNWTTDRFEHMIHVNGLTVEQGNVRLVAEPLSQLRRPFAAWKQFVDLTEATEVSGLHCKANSFQKRRAGHNPYTPSLCVIHQRNGACQVFRKRYCCYYCIMTFKKRFVILVSKHFVNNFKNIINNNKLIHNKARWSSYISELLSVHEVGQWNDRKMVLTAVNRYVKMKV